MDLAPHVRVTSRTGTGYEKVDIAAATERGIAVRNAPEGPAVSTAEHAIMLMLMVAKNAKRSEAALRGGESDVFARHVGMELRNKVLGLVGFGRIGRRVAEVAEGLGMGILAFDPYLPPTRFLKAAVRHRLWGCFG